MTSTDNLALTTTAALPVPKPGPVTVDLLSLQPGQTVVIPTAMCVYSVTITDRTQVDSDGLVRGVIITATRLFQPALAPVGTVAVDRTVVQGHEYGMGSVWRAGTQERIHTGMVGVPAVVSAAAPYC
jgi:hypothetical protein